MLGSRWWSYSKTKHRVDRQTNIAILIQNMYLDILNWFISPRGLLNLSKILKLKNIHKGKRCFIIGNGPSLNNMDLSLLKNEITFGQNRIYLLFDHIGFNTNYLVISNKHVVDQFKNDIDNLSIPKFISWHNRNLCSYDKHTNYFYIRNFLGKKFFSKNLIFGIWGGATVTFASLQLAYHMGFDKVVLIGVDHNFKTPGTPHKLVKSENDDPNHFDKNYFGKGVYWQLPDLQTSEIAYGLAKKAYSDAGREILDATVGGKLNIFKKADYNNLFV